MTTGAPPTCSMAGSTSERSRTNIVAGIPMPWRERIWVALSLSREFEMPWDVLGVYTSSCSNWRTTAIPKKEMDAPMRGRAAS